MLLTSITSSAGSPTPATDINAPQQQNGFTLQLQLQLQSAVRSILAQQRRHAVSLLPAPLGSAPPTPPPSPASVSALVSRRAARPEGSAAATAVFTAHPRLSLNASEQAELASLYGNDTVVDATAHDCFTNVAALRRQLAHEAKTEITPAEYQWIDPFRPARGDHVEHSTEPTSGIGLHDIASLEHTSVTHADGTVSQRLVTVNAQGHCVALESTGRFGVPAGWIAEDAIRRTADGLAQLRTRFIGPNGESGVVVRSFDGTTLHLDKAYKSTLPTRLAGVPGFDRPVATVNYMTARACKLLGVTGQNLQQIKINRLQHRPALMHLDWLLRENPDQTIGELIDHTTWAKRYIRETAQIVGRRVLPIPLIDPEGSRAWKAAHPGAARRDWPYLQSETERLTFKHLTRQKIDKVDEASGSWRTSAAMALARYKVAQCHGLSPGNAAERRREIDTLLQTRLAAIDAEESNLRRRYGMPPDRVPGHLNFDVTYRTTAQDT